MEQELDNDEKAALRAFLQRCEVRLSTMHRIAGAFLSGAGLLILFPIFFKDAFLVIVKALFEIANFKIDMSAPISAALGLSTFSALGLPLYALYLLIKDIVRFYFTSYHPGFPDNIFHPRFILSGLSFSEEGCSLSRKRILKEQQSSNLIHFVLPMAADEKKHRDNLLKEFKEVLIPETRKKAITDFHDELFVNPSTNNDDQNKRQEKENDLRLFYLEFGLAAVMDRPLPEEAAKMEASLVRHAISLRRLVLRYAKALLLFIWTTILFLLIASLVASAASHSKDSLGIAIYLAIFFAIIWHTCTSFVVKQPIKWIFQYANQNSISIFDPELQHFETIVKWLSGITLIPFLLIIIYYVYIAIFQYFR